MDQNNIYLNLRRIREARGLTRAEIADRAGISRVTYRNIENGSSIPKVSILQNIAAAVDVRLQDLLIPVRALQRVRFRASNKINGRENILAEVTQGLDDFNELEKMLELPKPEYKLRYLAYRISKMERGADTAEYAAAASRKALGLSETEPIRDMVGLFEANGIKVYPLVVASDEILGLSVDEEEDGAAVIVNVWERISVERWIFSAAHELGHLLLHLDSYDVAQSQEDFEQEIEANIFASHFLMPEPAFRSEWDKTAGLPPVARVLKLKRIFQVSYKTVLYRLSESIEGIWPRFYAAYKEQTGKSLGSIDEPEAMQSDQYHAPEVLRSKEPDSLSPSYFVEDRLSRLVRQAIENQQITLGRGAEILKLDIETMRDLVSSWV